MSNADPMSNADQANANTMSNGSNANTMSNGQSPKTMLDIVAGQCVTVWQGDRAIYDIVAAA